MAKATYHVKGTAAWPKDHPSTPTTEWEGWYEADSEEEAAALGLAATTKAWDAAVDVKVTEVTVE